MKRKLNIPGWYGLTRVALLVPLFVIPILVAHWVFATGPEPYLVKNLSPAFDSNPQNLTDLNGNLYFSADDGVNGEELFRSDGTVTGTYRVADINPGPSGSLPGWLKVSNGILFFKADGGVFGEELWRTDGTLTGTVQVRDIYTGPIGSSPTRLTDLGGALFFSAVSPGSGRELWTSDGTMTGTLLVKDIYPGGMSGDPRRLTAVNGALTFIAAEPNTGLELWTSDGTTSGTRLVRDINPGAADSYPSPPDPNDVIAIDGTVFFSADDGVHGIELWKSDGTLTGTVLVKDIYPGAGDSSPDKFANVNGTLYFRAISEVLGIELWKSDGTITGTVVVKDINPGLGNSMPSDLFPVNDRLFFNAVDGVTGRELWVSDGSPTGTRLVKDINPGPVSGSPVFIGSSGDTALFRANNGINGIEFWKSGGSEASTTLVADINPGGDSDPFEGKAIGLTFFFSAFDNQNGRELWALDLTNTPPTANAGGPYSGLEGATIPLTGTAVDLDDNELIYDWTVSSPDCTISGANTLEPGITCGDDGVYTATLTVSDWWFASDTSQATVTTENLPPTILSYTFTPFPVRLNQIAYLTVDFTDPGNRDTHSAMIDWGDTITTTGSVDQLALTVSGEHIYTDIGDFILTLTLRDDDGAEVTDEITITVARGFFLPFIQK